MPTAYIGLGANLASFAGPPPETLAAALLQLGGLGRVAARSSLYNTDPVGFAQTIAISLNAHAKIEEGEVRITR